MQLNKDIQNTDLSKKEEKNKDGLNTDSIPMYVFKVHRGHLQKMK